MDEQLLHGHNSGVYCVALRSNGHVASGSDDRSIIVHSTSSNKVEYRADNVFAYGVYGLCYLPNGSGLVACGQDGPNGNGLKVFSPSLELVQILVGHVGPVCCVRNVCLRLSTCLFRGVVLCVFAYVCAQAVL